MEKAIKQEFEGKIEYVVLDDAYIGGSYYHDANTLKKKDLKGISAEEVYKLEFNCIDKAITFYNLFAKVTRFSIWKDDLKLDKNRNKVSQKWVCYREGCRLTKFFENENRECGPQLLTRVEYETTFHIGLNQKVGKWIVKEFKGKHNHHLVDVVDTIPSVSSSNK